MAHVRRTGYPTLYDRYLHGDFWDRYWLQADQPDYDTTVAPVNVRETDREILLEVAAPGREKKDFRIHLDNERLIISFDHGKEIRREEEYSHREFSLGPLGRTFSIPKDTVNIGKISAKYRDGILHIILPKRDVRKTSLSRNIKIS